MRVLKQGPSVDAWRHEQACCDCGATVEVVTADVIEASTQLSGAMFVCPCEAKNRVEPRAMPEAVWRAIAATCAVRVATKGSAA